MSKLLGKRKVRDEEPDQVGAILDWFQQVEDQCDQKRDKQRECAVAGGACRMLKSVLVTNEFDVTEPLAQLARKLADHPIQRTHPVTFLFCRQWADYVSALYGGCATEVIQKQKIDPQWFEKRVAKITFETVFDNELWNMPGIHRNTSLFDTLSEHATVVQRRPEELLAVSECIRGPQTPGRIMDHVGHRYTLAKLTHSIAVLLEWRDKSLVPLVRQLEEFKLRDPSPLLAENSARKALQTAISDRLTRIRQEYQSDDEQLADLFTTMLPTLGKDFVDKGLTDLASKKPLYQKKINIRLQFVLLTSWCHQIAAHWTSHSAAAVGMPKKIRCILLEEEEAAEKPAKRVRLFLEEKKQQPEQKFHPTGTGLLGVIQSELASATDHADLGAFMQDTLGGRVLPLLQKKLAEDSQGMERHGDINTFREALATAAATADVGLWMQQLSERGRLNHSVIHQQQQQPFETPEIDRLQLEYEAEIVKAVLAEAGPVREGFLSIHKELLGHLKRRIGDPVDAKLEQLKQQHQKLSERVLIAEPWFSTAVISPELRQVAPDQVATVANAINHAQRWFLDALSVSD